MKKKDIISTDIITLIKAMNHDDNIVCETPEGDACQIDKIHCEPGVCKQVNTRIDYSLLDNSKVACEQLPDAIRLYHRTFEDGDYVRLQCGDMLICAGVEGDKYLFHAALTKDGELQFPDEFYKYGSVMPDDRLCTDDEMMQMNGALMKEGKILDPASGKIVDSIFKKHPSIFKDFVNDYKHYQDLASKLPKVYVLGGPIISQRGKLTTREEIQDCITAYETHILELTEMCNELYKKQTQ